VHDPSALAHRMCKPPGRVTEARAHLEDVARADRLRQHPAQPSHLRSDDGEVLFGGDDLHLAQHLIVRRREVSEISFDVGAHDHDFLPPQASANAAGQCGASTHSPQFGLRAKQMRRPCQIIWCENWIQRSRGIFCIKFCSIFLGSSSSVSASRALRRATCVSTTTPSAIPYAVPSTTFAVLRATPGSSSSASISRGTSPACLAKSPLAIPIRLLALFRKKPVD